MSDEKKEMKMHRIQQWALRIRKLSLMFFIITPQLVRGDNTPSKDITPSDGKLIRVLVNHPNLEMCRFFKSLGDDSNESEEQFQRCVKQTVEDHKNAKKIKKGKDSK